MKAALHIKDLSTPAATRNPECVFSALRKQGDVVKAKFPLIGDVWMTLSYESTARMLKDNERFAMRAKPGGEVSAVKWWMPRSLRLLGNNMLTSDEPDHRRLRQLVDQAFARRAVGDMEEKVQAVANDLVPRGSGPVDLVPGYCRKLPLIVIADLLGIDPERRDIFAKAAEPISSMNGMMGMVRLLLPFGPLRHLRRFVEEEIETARGASKPGLLSALIEAEQGGDRLSHDELVAMVFLLLIAGHETTTHLIAGSVIALDQEDEQRRMLIADPSLYDMAVEELLRFVSPVQFTKPRTVQSDGDFFGVELKKGETIMGGLAAANMDPAQFEHSQRLDLTRKPNPHVEFGTGIHFCLGFQLARLEARVALRTLYDARPELKVKEFDHSQRPGMRAVTRLIVA